MYQTYSLAKNISYSRLLLFYSKNIPCKVHCPRKTAFVHLNLCNLWCRWYTLCKYAAVPPSSNVPLARQHARMYTYHKHSLSITLIQHRGEYSALAALSPLPRDLITATKNTSSISLLEQNKAGNQSSKALAQGAPRQNKSKRDLCAHEIAPLVYTSSSRTVYHKLYECLSPMRWRRENTDWSSFT